MNVDSRHLAYVLAGRASNDVTAIDLDGNTSGYQEINIVGAVVLFYERVAGVKNLDRACRNNLFGYFFQVTDDPLCPNTFNKPTPSIGAGKTINNTGGHEISLKNIKYI